MSKIGILYICTGKYVTFWPEFYTSAEKYLLKNSDVHYYIFTDAETLEYAAENDRIHMIPQKAYSWPYSTLLRFSVFLAYKEELKQCDYLFFFNANAQFMQPVTEEMFLPRKEEGEELLVVQHPGFFDKKKYDFTYDRNPRCSAYIPYWKGDIYICGGINGGTSDAFINLCECLSECINKDLAKNIIPLWHDESHINKYIMDRDDVRVLSPSFCAPENWDIPFECIILIRDKSKYFDVMQLRKGADETGLSSFLNVKNNILRMIVKVWINMNAVLFSK